MNDRDPRSVPSTPTDDNYNSRISESSYDNNPHRHHREKCGPLQSDRAFLDLASLQAPLQAAISDIQSKTPVEVYSSKFLPPNWPAHVKYLVDYEYHPSIIQSTLDLVQGRRRKGADYPREVANELGLLVKEDNDEKEDDEGTTVITDDFDQEKDDRTTIITEGRGQEEQDYDEIPTGHAIPGLVFTADSTATTIQRSAELQISTKGEPLYEIRFIDSPNHPVYGSYGLFALKTLRPGLHLLDYISLVVPDESADPDSDHTLYLCNDLNLDASVHGNHGRFVNDFRGIRTQEQGPNVGWDLYRDADTGQVRMGCKVLKRIRKGEEILCTYGHDYWKSRGVEVEGEEWEDGWDTDLDDVGSSSDSGESDDSSHEDEEVKDEVSQDDFEDTFRPPRRPTPDRG